MSLLSAKEEICIPKTTVYLNNILSWTFPLSLTFFLFYFIFYLRNIMLSKSVLSSLCCSVHLFILRVCIFDQPNAWLTGVFVNRVNSSLCVILNILKVYEAFIWGRSLWLPRSISRTCNLQSLPQYKPDGTCTHAHKMVQ